MSATSSRVYARKRAPLAGCRRGWLVPEGVSWRTCVEWGGSVVRRLLIGSFVIVLALGLVGCKSVSEKIGEEIAGGVVGADVEVDEDRVTIETDEGETTIAGGEAVLVQEFPDDFPLYDAKVETSTMFSESGREHIYVLLSTGDTVNDVYDWYRSKLEPAGWTLKDDVKMNTGDGELAQLVAESGDREVALMISAGDDGTEIVINLYLTE
ncbi:MAG: hypothetical protein Q7W44_06965 [Coriobacteriia bacterium]|nr:hypothetical protein [Coriobacteriia bacterium]